MLPKQTREEAARFASQVYLLEQVFVPQFALNKTGFNGKLVASPKGHQTRIRRRNTLNRMAKLRWPAWLLLLHTYIMP